MHSEKRLRKRYETQQHISNVQANEISRLKSKITELEITCEKKDEIIRSVDGIMNEFFREIEIARQKQAECKKILDELREMKSVMNQSFFKGRWKLIRFLLQ